jgi:hypothetical protein
MEEDKESRRKEGEGTRGGEGRGGQQKRGKGHGPANYDAWQIAAPVTYQFVRRFCVVQHALLDIIALCLINY